MEYPSKQCNKYNELENKFSNREIFNLKNKLGVHFMTITMS